MAKLQIGDIIEVRTSKGLAYAQYTHKHKQYGALLRVFNQTHTSKPNDLAALITQHASFLCFFPLDAAVARGIVNVVGNAAVPPEAQAFPTFRAGVIDPSTHKVAAWWLWDGEKEWKVGELTHEQRKLSIRGVWNDTFLVDRIESGWTPETDNS